MRRRDFIKVITGSAAAWPLTVRAQASLPLIGFMSSRSSKDSEPHSAAFLRGLSEAGFIPGQNAVIESRWADGHYERLPEIASELVKLPLAALVAAGGEPSAQAAKSATASIPIIFVIGGDPVKAGLTTSLNRPGTNATGVSFVTNELGSKRVNLIVELVPNAATIALLVNPNMVQTDTHIQSARMGADALGRRLLVLHATTPAELEPNFNAPLVPVESLVHRPDFPACALGMFVELAGYAGVVVELVGRSLKIRSREGATRSYNADGLRKIYGGAMKKTSGP